MTSFPVYRVRKKEKFARYSQNKLFIILKSKLFILLLEYRC